MKRFFFPSLALAAIAALTGCAKQPEPVPAPTQAIIETIPPAPTEEILPTVTEAPTQPTGIPVNEHLPEIWMDVVPSSEQVLQTVLMGVNIRVASVDGTELVYEVTAPDMTGAFAALADKADFVSEDELGEFLLQYTAEADPAQFSITAEYTGQADLQTDSLIQAITGGLLTGQDQLPEDSQLSTWLEEKLQAITPSLQSGEAAQVDHIDFSREQDENFKESARITAYSNTGSIVWCYMTPKAILTELRPFLEIGQRGDNYYLAENGSVVCLDVNTGVIRWKNTDIGARAISFAFGEDAIYLTGHYGPDFYAVSYEGETLARIYTFDPEYFWADEIELHNGTATVYLTGNSQGSPDPKAFHVNLKDYSYN